MRLLRGMKRGRASVRKAAKAIGKRASANGREMEIAMASAHVAMSHEMASVHVAMGHETANAHVGREMTSSIVFTLPVNGFAI